MFSSDTSDDELRAPNEEAAQILDTSEEATPITDTTPVLNAHPLSNTPTITDLSPVPVANPPRTRQTSLRCCTTSDSLEALAGPSKNK